MSAFLADRSVRRFAQVFLVIYAAVLLVAWPSLTYPWYWDDFHLIREFGPDELARVFHGPWDVDGIESVSYRPLWVVVNHARAWLLGEHVVAHRLFLTAALALFTTLMTLAVQTFGLSAPFATCAAVVSVWAKSNHANLMWPTDATHALSGIPVALACYLPLRASGAARVWSPVLVFVLALISLLVREDIAALFPVVVLLQVEQTRRGEDAEPAPRVAAGVLRWVRLATRACAPLVASLGVYFALRHAFVAGAVMGFNAAGLWAHAKMTFLLMGTRLPFTIVVAYTVSCVILLSGALLVPARRGGMRWQIAALAGCALAGCAPGLVLERSNLLMVPNLLFCFALASAVQSVSRAHGSRSMLSLAAIAVCATFSVVTFRQTRRALLCGHPDSTETVRYTADFLYGQYASRATIPSARRAAGEVYLRRFGIHDAANYGVVLPTLIEQAGARPRRPDPGGHPFNPPSPFLAH